MYWILMICQALFQVLRLELWAKQFLQAPPLLWGEMVNSSVERQLCGVKSSGADYIYTTSVWPESPIVGF